MSITNSLTRKHIFPRHLQLLVEEAMDVIYCWHDTWGGQVCANDSGGMDSAVQGNITDVMYDFAIPRVFVNTGNEYRELVRNVRKHKNLVELRPKVSFAWVIKNHGLPIVGKKQAKMLRMLQNPSGKNKNSRNLYLTGIKANGEKAPSYKLAKRWYPLIDAPFKISEVCCDHLKHGPLRRYQRETGRKPIVAVMADEGGQRARSLKPSDSCNNYDAKEPISRPLKNWTKQDVLLYVKLAKVPIPSVYGDIIESKGQLCTTGVNRTGCMWCMFGIAGEQQPNRFQQMQLTHPLHHKCLYKLGITDALDYMNEHLSERQQIPYLWSDYEVAKAKGVAKAERAAKREEIAKRRAAGKKRQLSFDFCQA